MKYKVSNENGYTFAYSWSTDGGAVDTVIAFLDAGAERVTVEELAGRWRHEWMATPETRRSIGPTLVPSCTTEYRR